MKTLLYLLSLSLLCAAGVTAETMQAKTDTLYLSVPSFYTCDTLFTRDTSYYYELYDEQDSAISILSVHDFGDVRFISLFKSYVDPYQTYKDSGGLERPMRITKIIYRYDRTGTAKWMAVDYASNKCFSLHDVRAKSRQHNCRSVRDPASGGTRQVCFTVYELKADQNAY